jgi:DNA-directed RNA polymerase specialized sigma24 family protein
MALVPVQPTASAAIGVTDGPSRVLAQRARPPVTRRDVQAALAAMSAEHRRVIVEIYYHRRSVAETADVLGIGESRVAALAYWAVRQLPRTLAVAQRTRAPRPR